MPNVSQAQRGETLVSGKAMAQLLGVAPAKVQELARRGVIPKASRDRYPMVRGVSSYCTHLRALAAGRPKELGDPASEEVKPTVRSLDAARLRLLEEQTEGQKIKNEEARGRLVSAEAVAVSWGGMIAAARSRIRAVPRRAAMMLGLDPDQAIGLQRLVDDALEEVADGHGGAGAGPGDEEGHGEVAAS